MNTNTTDNSRKIAIIGMSCRLPGADTINQFWENLVNGKESLTRFTDEELRAAGVDEAQIRSPHYVRSRGIINGAEYFDAAFFGITPRDAEIMDPQHRIFLECAWHALEDAAYDPEKSRARIGVFGGTGVNWHLNSTTNNPEVTQYASGTSIVTGNDKDYVATRVSYKLNLTGPSLTVQCACSTSMAAVVMGTNSLLSYQSDMVLAGGATIELPERRGYLYQEGGLESSDGHCRTFDKEADGTVFSRGAGVVLLKRYEEAVADGDHIYAVLLGGAINNDGNRKVGFTAPSVEGQVNVALEAIELSEIDVESIGYVEAHGTATAVGDPIEVTSLTQVFGTYSAKKQFCAIGSVKTNIGHTDSASGVAGLIKAALALKNRKIPAHLHFNEANPKIDFANSPFYVNTSLRDWESKDNAPRRALVNSFGVGGTNACVILEEAPQQEATHTGKEHKVLLLSAKTDTALETTKSNLHDFLAQAGAISPDDLAYTYQVGRRAYGNRLAITFASLEELQEKLLAENSGQRGHCEEDNKPVIFMFPGQGNQYHNMGRQLYAENILFRQVVDECCDFLLAKFQLDLRSFIFAEADSVQARQALEQTYITQPAIFVISYAMARLLMSKGIRPEAMIGHSVGEYVAACLSGIMSLEDALTAVARRGALIQKLPGGSMLAVLQNEDKILPHLFPGVEVAAVNNPGLCVIAGADEHIERLEQNLSNSGFFCKRLSTSHAFHSAMMEPCLPEFATLFDTIRLSAPTIPIISTVTGHFLTDQEARDPDYWVQHVRKTVRFTDAVLTCLDMNPSVFLEVGPGQSLESAVKRHLGKDAQHAAVRSMTTETETTDDNEFLAAAIGNVWLSGGSIDWTVYYRDQVRRRLSLPCYPYERQAYSIDFSKIRTPQTQKANFRYPDISDWYSVPVWKRSAPARYLVSAVPEGQAWLLLHDPMGLGREIARQLRELKQQVVEVHPGAAYAKTSDHSYTLDTGHKESYEELVKAIGESGIDIQNIVHLLNYTPERQHELQPDELNAIEDHTFFSPLYLQQAFYAANKLKELQFSMVANGVFDVVGEKVYAPEKALAIGPCRVLIQEFPTVRARFIDADLQRGERQLRTLARNIILESQQKGYETLVAYRNGYRWQEGYNQFPFGKAAQPFYKDKGIYLITGGLGGIGIVTAKAIASEVKATFVLTYQSAFPARAEWDHWLEQNPGISFTREKIEGIRELEALGATVLERQVNVADYEAMKRLEEEIRQTYGAINGVIHSAGAVGGGVIPLKTRESVRPVFDSKLAGTLVLDKVFAGQELDFFLLYSSITSILGEGTRMDYCSANAFLDAFAAHRKWMKGDNTISINWSGWTGTGMAVRWQQEQAERTHKGKAEAQRTPLATDTILRTSREMLHLLKQDGDTYTFDVSFRPAHDWIINSHFIIGQPTVVGTTFIELACQAGRLLFPDKKTELRNLYFISPLMFENGTGKKTRLVLEEKGDKLKFSFRTQPLNKNEDKDIWHDHFSGELLLSEHEAGSINLNRLRERLGGRIDESKSSRIVYNKQNMPLIDLGDRWDIDNKIYVGEHEWLAHLSLRSEFFGDTDYFDFHPAIMDKATSFALRFMSDTTFLPFSYKSVRTYGKLPAEVYAYVVPSNRDARNQDAVAFDITLLDTQGNVLLEIREYTMKQVNDLPESSRTPNRDKATAEELSDTFDYLDPQQGEEVIRHILSSEFPEQLIVYPCDFDFMLEDNLPDMQKRAEKEKQKNANKSYYSRPSLSTPYVEPANEMEKTIARIWQDILGLDKVGRDDTFTELGGNSLLAIQTIANIVDVLEVELSAQVFYDNPTVKGLAEAVVTSIMDLNEIENLEELIETMGLEEPSAN